MFFCVCLPFLFAILRSETTLSRVRDLCPSFDDPLELDESVESLSDPLEPDEPVPCATEIKISMFHWKGSCHSLELT